jgi:predicted DNA-binding protein
MASDRCKYKMQSQEEIVKTSVRLPKTMHKQLKLYCLDVEKTEVEIITEAVTEYLKNHATGKRK